MRRTRAGQEPEALRVALVAPVEQELEAEADPEHVRAAVGGRPDGAGQAGGSQALHRGARRADAGDDEQPRPLGGPGLGGDLDADAQPLERRPQAAQVAGAVVDDRHGGHRLPFVEGISAGPARIDGDGRAAARAPAP